MNSEYVVDTMALVLRLERRRPGSEVKKIFTQAENGIATIFIPAMVLAEIGYLAEKNRIDTSLSELYEYCSEFPTVRIIAITKDVVTKCFQIEDIPELHDRIIAGTAYDRNLALLTNDPMIEDSKFIKTVW